MTNETLKKILIFTRPLAEPWDEASKNLAYEIARQAKGSFEFHLLTTKKYTEELSQNCQNYHGKKIIAEGVYAKEKFDRSEKIALLKRLFSQKDNLDLIHFLFTPRKLTSLLIRIKLKMLRAKTVQTIATINEDLYKNHTKMKRALFADRIVAQSNFTREKMEKAGIQNVEMIYPGIDLGKFHPQAKDKEFMIKYGIEEGEFVVLYAGEYDRLDAIDNIVGCIQFIMAEKPKNLKIKFVMACRLKGAKDEFIKQEFIEKMTKLGYDKHIVPIDFCEEMVKLYNVADVQIFPARKMFGKFDIPFVLIEQMACGKPLIVSDLDVLKEFIDSNKVGLIIDKNSPENFGKAILGLAQNKDKLEKLGSASFDYVNQNFNIESVVKKYQELYSRTITNKGNK